MEKAIAHTGSCFFALKMFEQVNQILDKAVLLDEGEAFFHSVDEEVKQLIIELNTKKQLGVEGVDADGDSLGRYADFTIVQRQKEGLQVGHVDFKVTGRYWQSWKVKVNKEFLTISVDQNRFDELVNELKFSATHVGLTEANLNILLKTLLTKYLGYIRRELSL